MKENKIEIRLVTPRWASQYLAISERKLWSLSKDKIMPTVRLGRAVRYDLIDLDNFISKAKGVISDKSPFER